MNYKKIYDEIIYKAKSENRKKLEKESINYIYYEKHHILPKCLGGGNGKENLILLTGREHYLCHKLLTYIYKNNRGIILAFLRMIHSKNFNKKISSRDYERAKKALSDLMTGKKLSEEHKRNIGKGLLGKTLGVPKSPESKIKMSQSRKAYLQNHQNPMLGKKRPEFGKNQIGEKNPMFGKHLSEEARKKLREFNKGKKRFFINIECKYCGLKTNPGNYARWHGEKCKHKL